MLESNIDHKFSNHSSFQEYKRTTSIEVPSSQIHTTRSVEPQPSPTAGETEARENSREFKADNYVLGGYILNLGGAYISLLLHN